MTLSFRVRLNGLRCPGCRVLQTFSCLGIFGSAFAPGVHAGWQARICPPGGKPPAAILRAGQREANRLRRKIEVEESSDTRTFAPKLIASQKAVDFRHPKRRAWLLLLAVAENGPRAHTPVSQLLLISSDDHRIIFEAPSRHPAIEHELLFRSIWGPGSPRQFSPSPDRL